MMTSSPSCDASNNAREQEQRRNHRLVRRHTSIHTSSSLSPSNSSSTSIPSPTNVSITVSDMNHWNFLCGLTAGMAQAGLFNPFDRALYLSVKNRVPFTCRSNFRQPYQGFFQSVGHRALSGGLYYPLEQFFMSLLLQQMDHSSNMDDSLKYGALCNFLAGTAAGSANALLVNPISAIKYKTWGRETNRGMLQEALEMLRKGGFRPFGNGMIPTVLRDLVFGGSYTFLRFELQYRLQWTTEQQQVGANFVAAALATIVSGPFNLARNIQYATKSRHVATSVSQVFLTLAQETRDQPTLLDQCKHLQNRLRLGWGTLRVAVGMAFGHYIYDKLAGMVVTADNQQKPYQCTPGSSTISADRRRTS